MHAVGYEASDKKGFPPAQQRHLLGAFVNVGTAVDSAEVILSPKESTRQDIVQSVEAAIEARELYSGEASTLRGKQGWLASHCYGRTGALGARFLARRQYSDQVHLTDHEVKCLRFIAEVVATAEPRAVPVFGPSPSPFVLYTDASCEEGECPRLGWVLLGQGRQTAGWTTVVPSSVMATWQLRKQQIFPAEVMAVVVAAHFVASIVARSDILVFVDNEGATSALVRGSSSQPDVEELVMRAHSVFNTHRIKFWIEWIDTESNPADGLSRAGVQDPWTQHQQWLLQEVIFPEHLFTEAGLS